MISGCHAMTFCATLNNNSKKHAELSSRHLYLFRLRPSISALSPNKLPKLASIRQHFTTRREVTKNLKKCTGNSHFPTFPVRTPSRLCALAFNMRGTERLCAILDSGPILEQPLDLTARARSHKQSTPPAAEKNLKTAAERSSLSPRVFNFSCTKSVMNI